MDSKSRKVLDLIRSLCSGPDDEFGVAKLVFREIAGEQGIHVDKLIPGGLAEELVCRRFGLIWNRGAKNGEDAKTKDGRLVEIKSSTCNGGKSNIIYGTGTLKGETKENKCQRYFVKWRSMTYHIWFIEGNKQGPLEYMMVLPGGHLARLILEILRNSRMDKGNLNFGAAVCKACGLIHRHAFLTEVFGVPRVVKTGNLDTIKSTVSLEEINWAELAQYFTGTKTIESTRTDCELYLVRLGNTCRT